MKIKGDTILITGGGTGIGQALAAAFHAEGAHVVIAGRRAAPLEETVAAHPGMAFKVLDVEDGASIAPFAAALIAEFPALNVLINNAGIMQAEDLTAEPLDLATAESTIAINILGPLRLTAALLSHLKTQPAATVMNVTSGLAFVPMAATPTYSATKAAMHSYSQSLRHQLRKTSVQVIELAPPGVATDLMPGHRENPNSMPLADYIAESVALLKADPGAPEICVERVKPLRNAEANGNYGVVFGMVNPAG